MNWCGDHWCKEDNVNRIDRTIHSAAIVIPCGFGAKFLRSLVNTVLWLTKPPMNPKIFDGDMESAMEFLSHRRRQYLSGELHLVPTMAANKCQ